MSDKKISTESYKGVRDFFPADMAKERHIFNSWSKTAESFGFERYDASILEPAELYRSKGAENEELVNEQTYTFTDRGDREVTLRPEMTPTVARMIAAKRRELTFPVRWYSIPNLFRYERPQRGRLREHWQLNCDLFGPTDYTADVEIITLAYQVLIDFGATPEMFTILINDRREMSELFASLGIVDPEIVGQITRLTDRKKKISAEEYQTSLMKIINNEAPVTQILQLIENEAASNSVLNALHSLGIYNAKIDRTIARGFDYYTGMVFEIVDTDPTNNRSMIGGGRYDDLTSLFGGEPISGVGFGIGDVTMNDFLTTHKLWPQESLKTGPSLMLIPAEADDHLSAQKIAAQFRSRGIKTAVDIGSKKLGKKIADAAENKVGFVIVVGQNEIDNGNFELKNLAIESSQNGSIEELVTYLLANS